MLRFCSRTASAGNLPLILLLICSEIIPHPSRPKVGDVIGAHWRKKLVFAGIITEEPVTVGSSYKTKIKYFVDGSDTKNLNLLGSNVRFLVQGWKPKSIYDPLPQEILDAEVDYTRAEKEEDMFL